MSKDTVANLTGSLKNFKGDHTITFKAENNQVTLTDK
jgi:hypothetical protein